MKSGFITITPAIVAAVVLLTGCGGGDNDAANLAIEILADNDTTAAQANDLSGLSYASDGRIYASGYTDDDPDDRQTVVARFDADGNPDQTFGDNGFVTLNLAVAGGAGASGDEGSLAVVEVANGDIIVAVNLDDGNGDVDTDEGTSAYLVRLDDAGDVVDTFGTDGMVEVVFGWPNSAHNDFADEYDAFPVDAISDLQVDSSGTEERIVVFGSGSAADGSNRSDRDRYITRVLVSDGSIDPDFNSGTAFTYHSTDDLNENARRGLVEDDGTITSAGYTNLGDGLGNHIILIRLLEDGTVDSDFGDFIIPSGNVTGVERSGVAVFNPFLGDGGFAECYAVLRQSGGGFVTAGYGAATSDNTDSSLGYQTTGGPDVVTFRLFSGEDGLDQDYGNPDAPGTQAIQSEGEGRPSEEDRGRDGLILPDDSAVFVGRYGGTAAVYLFTPDGQLDDSLDDDGILELDHPSIQGQFYAIALSPDGDRVAITSRDDSDVDGTEGARLVILSITEE